jgi:hypothetical protein
MVGQTLQVKDLRLSDYKVIVRFPTEGPETTFDVTNFCKSISWNYDIDQPTETYEFQFAKGRDLLRIIQPGNRIFIYGWKPDPLRDVEYGQIKSGVIWDVEINTADSTSVNVTAHDMMIYLVNNKGSHIIEQDETASQFVRRIAPLYGIPLSNIADTQIGMPSRVPFLNQSLFNMFATALQNTRDLGFSGRIEGDQVQFGALKFFLQSQGFRLALVHKIEPSYTWMFETGDINGPVGNVIEASNKFSMDSYRNVVKVYSTQNPDTGLDPESSGSGGGDAELVAAAPLEASWPTDPDILQYGMLAESVDFLNFSEVQANLDPTQQAQWQADDLLRRSKKLWNSGTIRSFNIVTIRAGTPVYAAIPQLAMQGKYYVKSGSHTITPNSSDMTLSVTFEDVLPFAYKSRHESSTDSLNIGY